MAVSASRPFGSRFARSLPTFLTVLAATVLVVFAGATPAHATSSVADMEKQIDKQWLALEPVIENYNGVHDQLVAQRAKADKLQKAIAPLALQVDLALTRVGNYSSSVYETGPASGLRALLSAGSATSAFDMLATVEQMASQQRTQIAGTLALQQKYEAQKKPIDALVASLSARQSALNAQRQTIQSQITKLDALRVRAYGQTIGKGPTRPVACPQKYTGDAGSKAAAWACNQIGKRYVWGAAGPNTFDCSGLTMRAWQSVGVTMAHRAYTQKHTIPAVSFSQLRPGDLVFYYTNIAHVTIYVGNGWVVSAPTSGDVVRMKRWNSTSPVEGFGRP